MYDENHNGIQLDDTASADLRKDPLLQGFLKKNDLKTLLALPDCVGVRIYNAVAVAPDTNSRIIAVAVRQNGSEIHGTNNRRDYLQSRLFDPVGQPSDAEQKTRLQAIAGVDIPPGNLPRKDVQFSSFFSRSMLDSLLADNAGATVEGVGFHKSTTTLSGGDFSTHTGVPYVRSAGQLQMAAPPFLKSDQPCPGICAQLVSPPATDLATAPTEVVEVSSDSNIYLLRWM